MSDQKARTPTEKEHVLHEPPDQENIKLNPVLIGLGILAVLIGVVSGLIMSNAIMVR